MLLLLWVVLVRKVLALQHSFTLPFRLRITLTWRRCVIIILSAVLLVLKSFIFRLLYYLVVLSLAPFSFWVCMGLDLIWVSDIISVEVIQMSFWYKSLYYSLTRSPKNVGARCCPRCPEPSGHHFHNILDCRPGQYYGWWSNRSSNVCSEATVAIAQQSAFAQQ